MFTIIVTGDRNWEPAETMCRIFAGIFMKHGFGVVVRHGDCRGVDRKAAEIAEFYGCVIDPHPAERFGSWPSCGPIRNSHMIKLGADQCLAFHQNIAESKGTLDCVRKALKAGIPTWLVDAEDVEPKRITLEDLKKVMETIK